MASVVATLGSKFLFYGIKKRGIPKAFGTPTSKAELGVAHLYAQFLNWLIRVLPDS